MTLALAIGLVAQANVCAAEAEATARPKGSAESYRLEGVELYVVGQILSQKIGRTVRVAPRIMMERVTIKTEEIPPSEVLSVFAKQLRDAGYQVDDSGDLIGILRPKSD